MKRILLFLVMSIIAFSFITEAQITIDAERDAWYLDPNLVGIEVEYISRESVSLSNYPNPFNLETKIRYQLKRTETASLAIYNVTGKLIRHLSINQLHQPGS